MVQVLYVYRGCGSGVPPPNLAAELSSDEKPRISAIENTTPDLRLAPGKHASIGRDHEYIRHGTLSCLVGTDLLSGEVLGLVRETASQPEVH